MTLYEIGFPADFCDWSTTVPRQVTGSINTEGAVLPTTDGRGLLPAHLWDNFFLACLLSYPSSSRKSASLILG